MSIDRQAEEVDKVKRSEFGIIYKPVVLGPKATLADALALMEHYHISGIPITVEGKLVGIITNRDIRFEDDFTQLIEDVMTKKNLVTARWDVFGRGSFLHSCPSGHIPVL